MSVNVGTRTIADTRVGGRTTPHGRTRSFADDFTPHVGTVDGYASWQGIDRSRWMVKGEAFAASDGTLNAPDKIIASTAHTVVDPERGLLLYGGRDADRAGAGYPLSNADRRMCAVAMRTPRVAPPPTDTGPLVVRVRAPWELLPYYTKHLWTFVNWVDYDVGGVTFQKSLEIDMETGPGDYSATWPRRLKAHWNLHIWHRIKIAGQFWKTSLRCSHPGGSFITLPDDPLTPLTIELRLARGSDFFDPTRTYVEWWVEDVVEGRLRRHWHTSPRQHLEALRGRADWGYDLDVPAAEPLPAPLAAVASGVLASSNWFRDDDPNDGAPAILGLNDLAAVAADPTWGPYYAIGARSTRPYSSVAEPGRTWLDEWNAVFDSTIAGTVVFHGGFQGGQFFLQEEGAPVLGDYTAHPTHVDDVRAFASPVSAIEIFAPGN